ncbi:hypothetical protein [Azospirillum endophyticum]
MVEAQAIDALVDFTGQPGMQHRALCRIGLAFEHGKLNVPAEIPARPNTIRIVPSRTSGAYAWVMPLSS